jgi:hypothetical protein
MAHAKKAQPEKSRFEFARAHILKAQRLETKLQDARSAVDSWYYKDEWGNYRRPRLGVGPTPPRRPKTTEEREEIKALEAAVVDARANLLLHDNDGRNL